MQWLTIYKHENSCIGYIIKCNYASRVKIKYWYWQSFKINILVSHRRDKNGIGASLIQSYYSDIGNHIPACVFAMI